jgi:hypothetical protein
MDNMIDREEEEEEQQQQVILDDEDTNNDIQESHQRQEQTIQVAPSPEQQAPSKNRLGSGLLKFVVDTAAIGIILVGIIGLAHHIIDFVEEYKHLLFVAVVFYVIGVVNASSFVHNRQAAEKQIKRLEACLGLEQEILNDTGLLDKAGRNATRARIRQLKVALRVQQQRREFNHVE